MAVERAICVDRMHVVLFMDRSMGVIIGQRLVILLIRIFQMVALYSIRVELGSTLVQLDLSPLLRGVSSPTLFMLWLIFLVILIPVGICVPMSLPFRRVDWSLWNVESLR